MVLNDISGCGKNLEGKLPAPSVRLDGLWAEIRNVVLLNIGQTLQVVAARWKEQMLAILRW